MEFDYANIVMIFLRVTAFLLVLPFFSAVNFPPTMRIALGALTSVLLAPLMPTYHLENMQLFTLLGVMFQEISIGLMLGFVARMIFYAVDLAGNVIASEMGLNMAAMLNPLTSQSEQAPGLILFFLATVVMLTLDLHHWVLMGFARTYMVLPIGGAHINAALFEAIVKHTGLIFVIALQISAPVMAVSFVITLVFAVMSRAVPQMNVFGESLGFRVAGGLVVFGFTMQLTAQHVSNYLNRLPDDLLRIAQLMGGS